MNAGRISNEKKQTARNLYVWGMPEEFVAMQLDLEIPEVIGILKEMQVYSPGEGGG